MEEWNRLGHMSLEELRAQKETLKEPYPVGDYKVMVNLGEEGYFSNGKCGAVPSGRVANCFNDTTITVFNSDGERQFNSRQLPLQVGIYTKEEIDELLNALTSRLDELSASLDGISMKYDPNEKTIKYYKDGAEIESGGGGGGITYEDTFSATTGMSHSVVSGAGASITRKYYLDGIPMSTVTRWSWSYPSGSCKFSYTYGNHNISGVIGCNGVYLDGRLLAYVPTMNGTKSDTVVLGRGKI